MLIDLHLRNTQTGETGVYAMFGDWTIDPAGYWLYIFEEGNYSCDCNRTVFFWRTTTPEATDTDWPDEDPPCGRGLIAIDKIVERGSGKILAERL